MNYSEVSREFSRFLAPGMKRIAWAYVRSERIKTFNHKVEGSITDRSLWNFLREIHPGTDFLPLPGWFLEERIDEYPNLRQKLRIRNPIKSFIKAFNPGLISDKIIPYPVPPGTRSELSKLLTAEERLVATKFNWNLVLVTGLNPVFIAPPKKVIPSGRWYDPNSAFAAWSAMTGVNKLPIIDYIPKYGELLEGFRTEFNLWYETSDQPKVLDWMIQKFGYKEAKRINVYDLLEAVEEVRSERVVPLSSIFLDQEPIQDNNPYSVHDFFRWEYSGCPAISPTWLHNIFTSLSDKYFVMQGLVGHDSDLGAHYQSDSRLVLDEFESHIWVQSGGSLLNGQMNLLPQGDFWETKSDDGSEGALGFLFGDEDPG